MGWGARITKPGTSLVIAWLAGFLALLPDAVLANSPLHLECSAEQSLPGRVLVCEYAMLGRLNEQFADLHDQRVLAGRAGSNELKRWVAARDACKDVECIDRLLEAGIRETRLVLDDVNSREPGPVLTNARGIPLRIVQKSAANIPAPPDVVQQNVQQKAAAERALLETTASLLMVFFLVAALAYAFVARRLAA